MSGETGFKCHLCDICDGKGCIGELPGMGGVYDNANFIENCSAWTSYVREEVKAIPIRLAPITGAIQNIGYHDERLYYHDMIRSCRDAAVGLSIGDGYPDEKLRWGIEALESAGCKGAVFIKPYSNQKILERMEWSATVTEIVGVDIDSWAIITMRNQVQLELKTATMLKELKNHSKLPFVVKGVFTKADIDLVSELKPDIVVVSNHGGRVDVGRGATAHFLHSYGEIIKRYTGSVWVDGGIRTIEDVRAAASLGADEVMIGRPFITALLRSGSDGVASCARSLR